MAIPDRERRELHAAVERGLGPRAADLLLAMTEPELPHVLRAEMGDLRSEVRAEIAGVRGEMAELRSEVRAEIAGVRGEMAELRSEVRTEIAGVRGEIAELRGEIAGLRGQIGAKVPSIVVANVASMIGVAGLVLAAGALV